MTPDVIIIGGGIAGVSAGAEIAAHARVLLLEAEPQIGYHATGRSAAIFIRNYGNQTLRTLNAMAEPFFDAPDAVSDHSLLSPRGELMLASEAELPVFEAYMQGTTGVERVDAAQAVGLVPVLRPERIAAALYEPGAKDIDVDRMLQGYARLLRARGGQIVPRSRVIGLSRTGSVWTVQTKTDQYQAQVVVNAGGAWAGSLGAMAGALDVGLQPLRRSAALIPAPKGHDSAQWPVFGSVAETWYAKPEVGQIMVSPADADPVEPHDAWPKDDVLAEGIDRFETATTLRVQRVSHSWAGLRTFAPDKTPVVGFDPNLDGFFWLAGQGGYGVQTAPALAQIAAGLVTRPLVKETGLTKALSPKRFIETDLA